MAKGSGNVRGGKNSHSTSRHSNARKVTISSIASKVKLPSMGSTNRYELGDGRELSITLTARGYGSGGGIISAVERRSDGSYQSLGRASYGITGPAEFATKKEALAAMKRNLKTINW